MKKTLLCALTLFSTGVVLAMQFGMPERRTVEGSTSPQQQRRFEKAQQIRSSFSPMELTVQPETAQEPLFTLAQLNQILSNPEALRAQYQTAVAERDRLHNYLLQYPTTSAVGYINAVKNVQSLETLLQLAAAKQFNPSRPFGK